MNFKTPIVALIVCPPAAASHATQVCELVSSPAYQEANRLVDSLQPRTSGQARVYACDGSEFTAGEALWMQGQMRMLPNLCADGTIAEHLEAAHVLDQVRPLIKAHPG